MSLITFLMQFSEFPEIACAERFASKWALKRVRKGTLIVRQEEPDTNEFIVLDGCLASCICDPEGNEVCVGLYVENTIVTPNIARTRSGISLVSIEATTDVLVAQLNSDTLSDLMISSAPIRAWANGVLREELGRKADREWCLAALGGSGRLAWFRENYSGYEGIFTHSLIASFLGITPVTLSRLRSNERRK